MKKRYSKKKINTKVTRFEKLKQAIDCYYRSVICTNINNCLVYIYFFVVLAISISIKSLNYETCSFTL